MRLQDALYCNKQPQCQCLEGGGKRLLTSKYDEFD